MLHRMHSIRAYPNHMFFRKPLTSCLIIQPIYYHSINWWRSLSLIATRSATRQHTWKCSNSKANWFVCFLFSFNLWKCNYLLDVLGAPQQLKQIASITQLNEVVKLDRLCWNRQLHGLDVFESISNFLEILNDCYCANFFVGGWVSWILSL